MSDFTYVPATSGTSLSEEPRALRAKFGDGYQQRIPDGINTQPAAWNLTFNVVEADADAIEALFVGWNGVDAFTWTPPGNKSEISVICTKWQRSYNSAHTATIAATFEEVFDFGTVVSSLDGGTIQEVSHTSSTATLTIVIPVTGGALPRNRVWQRDAGSGFVDQSETGGTISDVGLNPAPATYRYRVKTTDALNVVVFSTTVTVTMDAAVITNLAVNAFDGVIVNSSNGAVTQVGFAGGQVLFDAASAIEYATGVGAGATPSYTHTPVATPSGVVVMVDMYTDPLNTTISGVTYGGTGLTKVVTAKDAADLRASIWVSTATPPPGPQSVVVNHGDPPGGSFLGVLSVTVTGSNPTSQVRGIASNMGIDNLPSAGPIASALGDLVLGLVGQWAGSPVFSASGGQTIIAQGIDTAVGRAFMRMAGAASVDLSLNSTQFQPWRACTISLKPLGVTALSINVSDAVTVANVPAVSVTGGNLRLINVSDGVTVSDSAVVGVGILAFIDDFAGAFSDLTSRTPSDGGVGWVEDVGAWFTDGAGNLENQNTVEDAVCTRETGATNARVDWHTNPLNDRGSHGCLRYSAGSRIVGYAYMSSTPGGSSFRVYEDVGSGYVQLGSAYTLPDDCSVFGGGVSYKLSASVSGSTVRLYVNDVLVVTTTTTCNNGATKHGFYYNDGVVRDVKAWRDSTIRTNTL